MLSLPMLGSLVILYCFERLLLPKYFDKESYGRHRLTYTVALNFALFLWILPCREWLAINFGAGSALPPCTILFSTQTQKIFSQAIPFLTGTRKKSYFPCDWLVVLAVTAFLVALSVSYVRTINKDTNSLIVSVCQIYPYYISPLFFSCSLNYILHPVYSYARIEYEKLIGPWDVPENYVF